MCMCVCVCGFVGVQVWSIYPQEMLNKLEEAFTGVSPVAIVVAASPMMATVAADEDVDGAALDGVLQYVAACCSLLQCVAVCCSVLLLMRMLMARLLVVCCSMSLRAAVCCSVWQCVAVCCC